MSLDPSGDCFSDDRLVLPVVGVILGQDRDQLLRGGIPPTATLTDSDEPMRINKLAVSKRSLLLAALPRRYLSCGFVDIEAAFDVSKIVFHCHGRRLFAGVRPRLGSLRTDSSDSCGGLMRNGSTNTPRCLF
jgi:hypothetical protein